MLLSKEEEGLLSFVLNTTISNKENFADERPYSFASTIRFDCYCCVDVDGRKTFTVVCIGSTFRGRLCIHRWDDAITD